MPWVDGLFEQTPIYEEGGRSYKREDLFAPMGIGGPNGTKLRQLIWWINGQDARGIITGASVRSPQLSMTALVARHYGLPCTIVIGGTTPEKAIRHPNVDMAITAGAAVEAGPIGYNPAIQRHVDELLAQPEYDGYLRVNYGIAANPGATDDELLAFHSVSAPQVLSLPPNTRHLAMTMGSANSVASVLLGLSSIWAPPELKEVTLIGIGPNRLDWLQERLRAFERATGKELRRKFIWSYPGDPERAARHNGPDHPIRGIRVTHYDLHTTAFARYEDRVPWQLDGLDFHPTYEGKAFAYMATHREQFGWWWFPSGDAVFWIVGAEADPEHVRGILRATEGPDGP